jgi:hypothetical protein
MDAREFRDRLSARPDLELLGASDAELFVRDLARSVTLALHPRAVLDNRWPELEAVLLGRRRPEVMMKWTRIVGYFSATCNWNRSKLAELRDRSAGDYAVPEAVA